MAVFAATQIVAGLAALLQGPTAQAPFQDVYRQINFLALPAAYTGMGLFVVFILASDLSEEMKEIARHDPLTGLLNRRGFAEAAGRVLAQARRRAAALSVVLADIDHFKGINDTHGHACGDRALQHLASLLASRTRAQDVLARMGGEEFVLVLADTPPDQAARLAERLRHDLEISRLEDKGASLAMTASFGVAALDLDQDDLDALLKRADAALYRAKREGRNRVAAEPAA
jgi:diguanylate cyclase (GGDEF)-like protein